VIWSLQLLDLLGKLCSSTADAVAALPIFHSINQRVLFTTVNCWRWSICIVWKHKSYACVLKLMSLPNLLSFSALQTPSTRRLQKTDPNSKMITEMHFAVECFCLQQLMFRKNTSIILYYQDWFVFLLPYMPLSSV
jgi:hypothetical protein